jgi:hypothetical protein
VRAEDEEFLVFRVWLRIILRRKRSVARRGRRGTMMVGSGLSYSSIVNRGKGNDILDICDRKTLSGTKIQDTPRSI